jgi:crossover junction endodeoxyribonuclease RuvC
MLTIGLDPGKQGACAVLDAEGSLHALFDLPYIADGKTAWVDGSALQGALMEALQGRQAIAIVERVSAMPKQGVSSSFAFGVGFGSLLGVLRAMQIPIELVTPATWKRAMGLSSDKRASLDKARLLYPAAELSLVKHEGRAESILLAHFAVRRRFQQRVA